MSKSIFPVSVEEHKELINTLGKMEYFGKVGKRSKNV